MCTNQCCTTVTQETKHRILCVSDNDLSQLLSKHFPRSIWWTGLPPDPDDLENQVNSIGSDIFVYESCENIDPEALDISSCDLAYTTVVGNPEVRRAPDLGECCVHLRVLPSIPQRLGLVHLHHSSGIVRRSSALRNFVRLVPALRVVAVGDFRFRA